MSEVQELARILCGQSGSFPDMMIYRREGHELVESHLAWTEWTAAAQAVLAAGYAKRDLASGLPAAIEERDKALGRVKELEAAVENQRREFVLGASIAYQAMTEWDRIAKFFDIKGWPDFRDKIRAEFALNLLEPFVSDEARATRSHP